MWINNRMVDCVHCKEKQYFPLSAPTYFNAIFNKSLKTSCPECEGNCRWERTPLLIIDSGFLTFCLGALLHRTPTIALILAAAGYGLITWGYYSLKLVKE